MAEDNAKKPMSKVTKITIIALAALVVIGGVAAATYFFLSSKTSDLELPAQAAVEASVDQQEKDQSVPGAIGPMFDLDPFIVNILDQHGTRYLKMQLTMELSSPDVESEVKARLPQIRDAIILLVGSKTYNEVSDLQGKLQLRADIISRINDLLLTGKVVKIYFVDFVVQ